MSMLEIALTAWGAVTIAFAGVLIYRFLIAMREEDTLILSAAESKLAEEQQVVLHRLSKIRPYVLGLGWLSAALLAVSIAIWVFEKLKQTELG